MRVIKDLDNLPKLANTVITIGSFDGLHKGHIQILDKLKGLSEDNRTENIVITFNPHPRKVIFPDDDSLKLLTSLEEKIALLEGNEIDNLAIIPFTKAFAQQSPEEYIQYLVLKFNPSHIVIGYDHKFGANRSGNIDLLKKLASKYNYQVHEISKQEVDDITISSTKVRKALVKGNIAIANALLSRPYSITGKVVKGRQLGTELGYPTANIDSVSPLKLIPQDGIYVCSVRIDDIEYYGMLYIGDIPTLEVTSKKVIEVNIFDFDKDIYGKTISVDLLSFLREDRKFDSLTGLKEQLKIDKENSLAYLNKNLEDNISSTTVAILNFNSSDFLETFLPSVSFSSRGDFETLVIDNNSSDDSMEMLEEWFPEVKVVQLQENYGFAAGYNKGLARVRTKYIAFLNSDVEVTKAWLDPLVAYLEKHEDVGAVMPKILSYEAKYRFEYAGACGGYMDMLAYPFCRGRVFDDIEHDQGQYESIQSIAWISGAAFVMRKDLYMKLGGFDNSYFAHQEEIDLCWRIRRAGYKLVVLPESKVYHVGGGTLNYGSSRKVFLNFRNSLSTLYKNESIVALLWKLPLRLVLDGVAGLKFLMGGNSSSFFAVIKAHFAFYSRLPKLSAKKRSEKKAIEAVKIGPQVKDGFYPKSIVFQYFIKGKKTFSQLMNSVGDV